MEKDLSTKTAEEAALCVYLDTAIAYGDVEVAKQLADELETVRQQKSEIDTDTVS